jgi:hypothetical protein
MKLVSRILRDERENRPAMLHVDNGQGAPLCSKGNCEALGYVESEGEPTCKRCARLIQPTRRIVSSGYVHIYDPDHPLANNKGYAREHRKIWFDAYGEIPAGHVIHHINRNKFDNRLENLVCLTKAEHGHEHLEETLPELRKGQDLNGHHLQEWKAKNNGPWNKGTTRYVELTCTYCGCTFQRNESTARSNERISARPFCSLSCGVSHKNRNAGQAKKRVSEFLHTHADEYFTATEIAKAINMPGTAVRWGLTELQKGGQVINKPAPKGRLYLWTWNAVAALAGLITLKGITR